MPKIRILATEDDALHEEMLRITMDKLDYELIDVIYKPAELLLKINATKPDLLLMDIDLGEDISGIELMKKVNETHDIPVIYVTSFADSETFQKAKKTFPAAYLVKPYVEKELQRAIELAIFNKKDKFNNLMKTNNDVVYNDYIYIKEDNSLNKIELKSILLIEAYDKYCFIYTSAKKRMIRYKLQDIALQLPVSQFCQVHRSYIVNLDAIDKIEMSKHIIHVAGKEIAVSKTFKNSLFSKLQTIG